MSLESKIKALENRIPREAIEDALTLICENCPVSECKYPNGEGCPVLEAVFDHPELICIILEVYYYTAEENPYWKYCTNW